MRGGLGTEPPSKQTACRHPQKGKLIRHSKPSHSDPSVFISYAKVDEHIARLLADALRQVYGDRRVLTDKDAIAVGENWAKVLGQTIGAADVVVVLMSPGYFSSQWAQAELAQALVYSKRLLPVMVRPCEVDGPLAHYTWLDFQEDSPGKSIQEVVDLVKGAK